MRHSLKLVMTHKISNLPAGSSASILIDRDSDIDSLWENLSDDFFVASSQLFLTSLGEMEFVYNTGEENG